MGTVPKVVCHLCAQLDILLDNPNELFSSDNTLFSPGLNTSLCVVDLGKSTQDIVDMSSRRWAGYQTAHYLPQLLKQPGKEVVGRCPHPHMKRSLVPLPWLSAAGSTAYTDVQITIDDILDESDRVMTRWSAAGTHKGGSLGIAPTDK